MKSAGLLHRLLSLFFAHLFAARKIFQLYVKVTEYPVLIMIDKLCGNI